MAHPSHVTILLATHNGAKNLRAQLESIAVQDFANWSLIVSDDNSSDETRDIINNFGDEGHEITLLDGPCHGAGANFMSLLTRYRTHVACETYLAFCDQDDVWLPDRLTRGIAALGPVEDSVPALYCSRTWLTDARLNVRRMSARRPRALSFRNALVQNVASGNTTLLNPAAAQLVADAAHEPKAIVVHDWWIYQIISGVGGKLVHDDEPTLLYRQHDGNEIGANDGTRAKLKRVSMLLSGNYAVWNKTNIAALRYSEHRLTPENRAILDNFARLAQLPAWQRLATVWRTGIYRQTLIGTVALWFAALTKRL
ncbi:glycosyltransferase family 2 protein [Aliiroseovarius sediminis]|uniref:glycosyltransferase family 2 protein n=1 Tax=Aliiroseovarius sediminis TaxID=2925839 RepID=UPI001F5A3814|nr:glycosyltransferase family 2 protein [Aliiroseovarius sediminis]MCI2395747.1 glycosyltransferase family 2 protein [Aliiroseovarius sediminis]